ncbi:sensor histidine kinase [Aestuariicella hydrocarbonica]|uniref:histidine kinase n=1 Tax=Pseudomaricurvus hydrocarbonicus TaxID=1470433 RepID=A0A9E5JQS9_9GAMM|nr:ATP-binding protein [Aestuariicella hydrocarbonica]NHO64992.1 sensor histidine kinase [Aestuariicella hydrocarbonica]
MRSIRTFLVIVLLSCICLVTFLAVLHGYRSSLTEAEELLERQLVDLAQLVAVIDSNHDKPVLEHYSSDIWFQVWSAQLRLEFRSENAPQQRVVELNPLAGERFHRVSFQGNSWRVVLRQFNAELAAPIWVVVAVREDIYAALTEGIILKSVLPIIWVLPLLGLLIWGVVSVGMHPLNRLANLLGHRKSDDLTPLNREGYPAELLVLVDSTNDLLIRLSEAFEREKRFSADAAHELRTPLAVLKVNLHNLAKNNNLDEGDYRALVSSADRIGSSIEQLLSLYRTSAQERDQALSSVDVAKIARSIVADCYAECLRKDQQIELEAETLNLVSDPIAISTLLRNLVDNAVKYTPEGGRILVTVRRASEGAVGDLVAGDGGDISAGNGAVIEGVTVQVEDSGPGIPEDRRKRVFDRFYRLGGDQHDSTVQGSGLGLSIVEHIVRLHHGGIALGQSSALGGLCIQVTLYSRNGLEA